MAIVSLSEAAELAGVSRGTLYNRLKRGELSRSGDGIDTSELMGMKPNGTKSCAKPLHAQFPAHRAQFFLGAPPLLTYS